MDYLFGEERILYIKEGLIYKPVGCLTANNMDESVDMLSTTTRSSSNGWKTGIPTTQSLFIPFEGIQIITGELGDETKLSYDSLKKLKRARTRIEWKIETSDGLLTDRGFGYITDIGETNQAGELLLFNGLIVCDGEPVFEQIEANSALYQEGSVICFQDGETLIF